MTRNGKEISERAQEAFSFWAENEGVSLEDENDWGPWFDCWCDGARWQARGQISPLAEHVKNLIRDELKRREKLEAMFR